MAEQQSRHGMNYTTIESKDLSAKISPIKAMLTPGVRGGFMLSDQMTDMFFRGRPEPTREDWKRGQTPIDLCLSLFALALADEVSNMIHFIAAKDSREAAIDTHYEKVVARFCETFEMNVVAITKSHKGAMTESRKMLRALDAAEKMETGNA